MRHRLHLTLLCNQGKHPSCSGNRRVRGLHTTCQCACHGLVPVDVEMPDNLKLWFRTHDGARQRIASLLHIRTNTVSDYIQSKQSLDVFRLNQIIACIELGLVPMNGEIPA